MEPNRRSSDRFQLGFPVDIATEHLGKTQAICLNVSTTGLQLATTAKPLVGAHIDLSFRVMPNHANPAKISATVIRVTDNVITSNEWPHLVAVQFDDPYPEIEPLLSIASQQKHLVGK